MRARSRAVRLCVSLACSISYGVVQGYISGHPFQVELRIVPGPGLDPRFVASAASELVAVWGPLGVDVVPFTKALSPRPATGVTMVIVEALPAERQANTLGWVGFQDDKTAAPLIFVSVSAVRRLIEPTNFKGAPFMRIPQAGRDRYIARAIGRAAAHELGHFLLSSRAHTRSGLMREQFHPQELIEEPRASFRLERTERTQLAARILDRQFLTTASSPPPNR